MVDLFCHESLPSEENMNNMDSFNEVQNLLKSCGITEVTRFNNESNVFTGCINTEFDVSANRTKCFIKYCDEEERDLTTLLSFLQFEEFHLSSERVVQIFPCVLPNPSFSFLVMKYYDACLEDIMQAGLFEEIDLPWICDSVLESLKFIHNVGIVHCDLKSTNIFVDRKQKTYVIGDFGLSCNISASKLGNAVFDRRSLIWNIHYYHIPRKIFNSNEPYGYEYDLFSYVILVICMYNNLAIRHVAIETNVQLDIGTPKLLKNEVIDPCLYFTVTILINKIRTIINEAIYNVDYTQFSVSRILESVQNITH